jgi:hypothetical protein
MRASRVSLQLSSTPQRNKEVTEEKERVKQQEHERVLKYSY